MSIETKNWSAERFVASINYKDGIFVSGVVTVSSSNIVPILVPVVRAGFRGHTSLELKLVSEGIGLPVLTEKSVTYMLENQAMTLGVDIHYKDEKIASIPVTR